MNKIILASHGELAKGMQNTIEMITGDKGRIHALCMTPDKDPSFILDETQKIIDRMGQNDQLFMFSDFPGGSVNTALTKFITSENIHLISGMNAAMLLEFVMSNVEDASQSIVQSVEVGKNAMQEVKFKKIIEEDIWED
ncbi:PTS sugar transporter subunit IIA [Enterococcus diestrammenae]|uniref:PTS system, fructoselysine/glucoselysine-specific IIA component n=1 Tax=Enterococcus diestrammenae TaxID=1155073 RepID=A0ABV0EXQ5_9ENTE|nr:PTS sugar transporter subunit IIA [Enterococcus diestrammenae]KAF1297296.1 hypothetical protein BAU18_08660 [Enterococcus diestrammenae]